ncbi:hypothetical protein HN51_031405 [Arachis hypogaea]
MLLNWCYSSVFASLLIGLLNVFRMLSTKGKKPTARAKQPMPQNVVVLAHPDMQILARNPNKCANKYCKFQGRHFKLKKKPHFEWILKLDKLPPDL